MKKLMNTVIISENPDSIFKEKHPLKKRVFFCLVIKKRINKGFFCCGEK